MTEVVLATGNLGKVAEMQATLQDYGFTVRPLVEFDIGEAVEDGLSFVENALKKARHACQHTGLPAIADDSGLEVAALNGAPGIYSARYAANEAGNLPLDEANNRKLLKNLEEESNRAACFQCVIVYMAHATDPTPLICHGSWRGEIAMSPRGDNGFGYDPVFYLPDLGKHSAELAPEVKNKISHRAQALVELQRQIATLELST